MSYSLAEQRPLLAQGKRKCRICEQVKPVEEYPVGRAVCTECFTEQLRQKSGYYLRRATREQKRKEQAEKILLESSAARNRRLALEGLRWCTACGCPRPISDFHKKSKTALQHLCKTCQTEYLREYKRIHYTPPVSREAGVCERCGAPKESATLHLCPTCKAESELRQKQRSQIRRTARQRRRRAEDGAFRMKRRVSERLREILGKKKSGSASKWTGCSKQFLKDYLASLFTEGMSWDNYGEWHIDHIIPQAYFDFNNPDEVRMCWNYRNLQPLWGNDNIEKGANLPVDLDERLAILRAVCIPSR